MGMLASPARSAVGLSLALPLRLSSFRAECVLLSGIGLPIWTDLLAWVLWVLTMSLSSSRDVILGIGDLLGWPGDLWSGVWALGAVVLVGLFEFGLFRLLECGELLTSDEGSVVLLQLGQFRFALALTVQFQLRQFRFYECSWPSIFDGDSVALLVCFQCNFGILRHASSILRVYFWYPSSLLPD